MKTTVVVCVDGFDPESLDQGIKDGILPTFQSFSRMGMRDMVKAQCQVSQIQTTCLSSRERRLESVVSEAVMCTIRQLALRK